MNPLLCSLGLSALLFALPVQAAPDPLAQGTEDHDAQILGWSADGKRFAMRLYLLQPFTARTAPEPPPFCEGYVNHESNYFRGGLVWLVYEGGRLLATLPLLDPETCTPVPEAEKRLADAKKRLSALGISLGATGKELVTPINSSRITVSEGPQAPYTLEYEEHLTSQTRDQKAEIQRGTRDQTVYVRKGAARRKVLGRKVPYEYSTTMAGYLRTGMERVWLSPSGTTLVVLGYEHVGNMSGGRKSLRLLGVLTWSGSTLKPF